jgi:MFS family permease
MPRQSPLNIINSFKSLEPDKGRTLIILFLTGLLFWTSITSLLPTLPTYISYVGGTTHQVGFVMGCFAIGLLLSRFWLGKLADQHSRKIVVLIGTVVAGVAPLGYWGLDSIPGLMAMRAFHGISIAAFTTGYSALVTDLAPAKQRGELMGYMTLAVPLGMSIGPALGSWLKEDFGYSALFFVSSLTGFLAFLLASRVEEESRNLFEEDNYQELPLRNFGELISSPSLSVPTLILLLDGLLFGTLVTFLPLFMEAIDINLTAGLFYTAAAIASFTSRVFVGKASDKYGRGLFITLSLICYGLSMLLLAGSHSPQTFLMAAVLEGIGGGILIPTMLALISDRCHGGERGKVYAFCIAGFDLGVAIAGPSLGFVAETLGYRDLFGLASFLSPLALLVLFTLSNKNPRYSLKFALGRAKDVYALK